MNPEIKLSLTLDEVNSILQTLGQLPTSSGAWPLMMKIKSMAEVQMNKPPEVPAS
jgi:hypothetical protein